MYKCFDCGYSQLKPFKICSKCLGTIILNYFEYYMEDEDE